MTGDRRKTGRSGDVSLDLAVEAGAWPPASELETMVKPAVEMVIEILQPPLVRGSELSILLTDDAHIRVLNRRFREKDRPTNVLSFPAASQTQGRFGPLLGDIVLASETVAREAEAGGLTLEHHLTHLIVHGLLHLFGHDHGEDSEAAIMESLESAILTRLGIADPYGEPSGA